MTSNLGRKRSISDLLDEGTEAVGDTRRDLEPPKTRRRVDEDTFVPTAASLSAVFEQSLDDHTTTKDDVKPVLFLAYPDVSDPKPVSTPFQQPSQLTTFSYTPEHVQEFTDSALRYYVDPPLGSNLSYGFERWTKRPDERGRIDALLKAVSKVKKDFESKGGVLPEIGVVSWRGVMTKILTAPYENRDRWELNVMAIDGTLYFEEHLTEERLNEKNNMDPRHRSQTYYGYAFESYCTSEAPPGPNSNTSARSLGAPPGWGGDVNTNVQWCSVVRTKLGDTRMIIGGEVDALKVGKYTGQTDTFVELKTSLAIRGRHDEIKFEKKLLKFYFQSFLLGVPEIMVGFRTPAGVLTTLQSFKTIQLPRMVRGKPGAWDPLVCLEFGHRVLTFLKDITRKDSGQAGNSRIPVWRAKFVPGSGLSVAELEPAEVEDVVNGEDRVGFLPRWYWDEIQDAQGDPKPLQGERSAAAQPVSSLGWRI